MSFVSRIPHGGVLAGAAVIGLIAGGLAGWATGHFSSNNDTHASSAVGVCDTKTVSRETMPSIVTVRLASGGVGSGEFVRSGGYIVTNSHVVASAPGGKGISVLLSSGQEEPAELVGRDPSTDLAVLRMTAVKAPLIDLGRSADLVVGQPVVALGSPLGLSGTVTSGIVSALGRRVPVPSDHGRTTELVDAIQTDASINPGNSGGALVDCRGHLVGINTAISTVPNAAGQAGGGSVGIGFAVPIDLAMPVVDSLIKSPTPPPATDLGITVTAIPPSAAEEFGVPPGLFVQSVVEGLPAAAAGLQQGDIILEVDGDAVTSADALALAAESKSAGDTIDVTFSRGGTHHSATIKLQ